MPPSTRMWPPKVRTAVGFWNPYITASGVCRSSRKVTLGGKA
jgi:hypothetical protein